MVVIIIILAIALILQSFILHVSRKMNKSGNLIIMNQYVEIENRSNQIKELDFQVKTLTKVNEILETKLFRKRNEKGVFIKSEEEKEINKESKK